MNKTQYELNQESGTDCWKHAQKSSSLRSREAFQDLPNTRSLAERSFSFVPLLSGGTAANVVSNRRTEQESEKITLKCKRSDEELFWLHHTWKEGAISSEQSCTARAGQAHCALLLRHWFQKSIPPVGGQQGRPPQHSGGGERFQHRGTGISS